MLLEYYYYYYYYYININILSECTLGYGNRWRDSLCAGRSADQIPVEGEIFYNRSDGPCSPHCLLCNRKRVSFPAVNRPGREVDHPPHLALMLKKEKAFMACFMVNFT